MSTTLLPLNFERECNVASPAGNENFGAGSPIVTDSLESSAIDCNLMSQVSLCVIGTYVMYQLLALGSVPKPTSARQKHHSATILASEAPTIVYRGFDV